MGRRMMKRRELIRRCKCPCNKELPSRYKGREKIFYDSPVCRKTWQNMTPKQQEERLKEIEEQNKKEMERLVEKKKVN